MVIEQIYTGCLAQGAYYIESNGEAAIIDPLREVTSYLERADGAGAEIKYIFETHFHADFVSGHVTLAEKTGAPIIYGPNADPSFEAIIAEDGQIFELGEISITAMHTPGHTMESTTYLLKDAEGNNHALFTGDTLFLGDVGRPDLAQDIEAGMDTTFLASTLYDSLRNKIMPLEDEVLVYPAHGAGSACGKNMMKITVDTLGNQRGMNYALRSDMSREEFIEAVLDGLADPPAYFPLNVMLNKEGYDNVEDVIRRGDIGHNPEAFEKIANETGALILDTRTRNKFSEGHLPRSIFIGLDGSFAPWVGELIRDIETQILLVTDDDKLEESITRLSRVGFDQTIGYLEGGVAAWKASGRDLDIVEEIEAVELVELPGNAVIDMRKEGEFDADHVLDSKNIPLRNTSSSLESFPKDEKFYVYCGSGYRSLIAASILKSRGYHNVVNVIGGIDAIRNTEITLVKGACQSS